MPILRNNHTLSLEENSTPAEGVGDLLGRGDGPTFTEATVLTAQVSVENLPAFNTIVVPYVNGGLETLVIDLPSVPPEISFYPFKNVNNQIEILLNSNTGRIMRTPIAITPEDEMQFEDHYLRQTGMSMPYSEIIAENKKIEFAKDDPPRLYEIYRVTEAPTAYTDFAGNLLQEVRPEYGIPGALVDNILPNIKYYYCARSIDLHGNISNPTFIYEIELVDNNGQIFLDQKVYVFPSPQPQVAQPGRRFIYVEPALTQVVLPEESLPTSNIGVDQLPLNSILGDLGVEKVWEKDFKLRVISKKTGRKLDLNIKFKNSGIVNQTE